MKIGFFLGSFDPIHNGHIVNMVSVINQGLVDRVIMVPAKHNPWKENEPVPYETRMIMCNAVAYELNRVFGVFNYRWKFGASGIERMTETNYTHETLKLLQQTYGGDNNELFIIGGTDVAQSIKDWKNGDWILDNFKIIEIPRSGYEKTTTGIEISSTIIRQMVAEGKSPVGFIPEYLCHYINKHNLYKN